MLLKWITCSVDDGARGDFSESQSAWNRLSTVAGFLGQCGGWDLQAVNNAGVLSFWSDEKSYRRFMDNLHDRIASDSGQNGACNAMDISMLQPVHEIPGVGGRMQASLNAAALLHVSDCVVRPDREEHFINAQKQAWIPSLSTSEGMLAGMLSKVSTDRKSGALGAGPRFTMMTLWRTAGDHKSWVEKTVPDLRARAELERDLESLTSRIIELDNSFLVRPVM